MSDLFQGLVSSAVTVYGVYKLGKTAYEINNSTPNSPSYSHVSNDDFENNDYEYYNEECISDKIIFIPKQYTERAIYENYLLEEFESNKQLFYYLRRRSNMEAIHKQLRIFNFNNVNNKNNIHKYKHNEILIFCTDLHSKANPSSVLYIIGILNDKTPSNTNKKQIIEKWKMNEYFLTSYDICNKYGIQLCDLPNGSFNKLSKEISNINMNKLLYIKNNVSLQSYSSLKCIKTKPLYNLNNNNNYNNHNYNITKTKFYKAIKNSNTLEPIISFSEDKNIYYIDMILLVNIDIINNSWIGIIFRDYTKNNNYIPIDIAIDCYDIRNKMILYKPPNNRNAFQKINKYQNNIIKININDDINNNINENINNNNNNNEYINDLQSKLIQANERINRLENEVIKNKKTIDKQSRDIAVLKEQNNHYFQQCLNPYANIKPHSIHLQASKAAPVTIFYTKK